MTSATNFFRAILLALALLVAVGQPASAGMLDPYKQQGLVGERPDGYAGLVDASAPADVRAMVDQVNAGRRAEYERIAAEEGTTLEAVQTVFGDTLIERAAPGTWIMTDGGQWEQK